MKTDYKTIKVALKDGVAILAIDNPPVNQISQQFGEDFAWAALEAFEDPEVKAVVLTGTGKNFVAGADITQVQHVTDPQEIYERALVLARFLATIVTGRKPGVAAINGNCLGGGAWKSPWPAITGLRPRAWTWASPRCRSGSFPVPAEPSACPASSGYPTPLK
jgi:1,4-dihydroxy-2-naphthoyl-CoA synthase